jgi:hypothetical protein
VPPHRLCGEPGVPPELGLAVDALIGKTEGGLASNFSPSTALCHDSAVLDDRASTAIGWWPGYVA